MNNQVPSSVDSFSIDSSNASVSKSDIGVISKYTENAAKAHRAKTENINMLQNADKDDYLPSTFESGDNVDKVLSGESLYKGSDEDVEKCMAFWKGVMQKKLEPIKCSIIESTNNKESQKLEKQESSNMSEKVYDAIKKAEEKVHDYYTNTWTAILNDLKKKKLNEIKLIGKSRCKMCQSRTSLGSETDSGMSKEEIVELSKWKPKSKGKKILEREKKDQDLSTDKELSKGSEKPITCICEDEEKVQHTVSVETIVSDRNHLPFKTERYKLIDLINEKKRTGAYSRWRKNTVQPCTCGVNTCDCNINPAIISTQPLDITCGCGQLQCQCVSKKLSEGDLDTSKQEIVTPKSDTDGKSIESCQCGKDCTCRKSKSTESPVTMRSLSSLSHAPAEITREKSEDTVITKLGEAEPRYNGDMYRHGPIKRNSKADVTKCEDDYASHTTLEIPKSLSDKCFCKQQCVCAKPETGHIEKNIKK